MTYVVLGVDKILSGEKRRLQQRSPRVGGLHSHLSAMKLLLQMEHPIMVGS